MIYYLLLLVWLAICYIVIYKIIKINNRKKVFLVISFLSLSFMSCFRDYSVGADTHQWVDFYTIYGEAGISSVNFSQSHEPGYVLLNVLLYSISPDPRLLLSVTSLFINFSVCYFIGNHSKDVLLSLLFWICTKQFFGSMCMVRQFIAISIVLLALESLLSQKYFRFLFAVIIAAFFHYFAVLNLILIPIFMIGKLRKWHIGLIVLLLAICFIFMPQIVNFFIYNVKNYSDYILYLQEQGAGPGGFIFPNRLFIFVAYLLPYFCNKHRIKEGKNGNFQYNYSEKKSYYFVSIIFLLIVCLMILSARFTLIARIYDYFLPFLMLLPNIVDTQRNKEVRVYYIILNIVYVLYAILRQQGLYGTENFLFFWD